MATAGPQRPYKLPESVLVVIHTPALDVLLIRRTGGEGHWQSVTGSKDALDEPFAETARREVAEETGIDTRAPGCLLTDWALENVYDIYPQWLHRYAPGVRRNTERLFGLQVPAAVPVRPGNYYFSLEPRGALYERMLQAQSAMIYAPTGINDLKFELIAVTS